jgi:hypothetical protein
MTTITPQVAAGGKDSYQVSGTADTTAGVVNGNGTSQWGAFVFDNITIPQGAVIISAYFEPYYTSASFDDPNVNLYLENVDNPAALASAAADISGRTITTGVNWTASGVGTGFVQGPDIGAAVQTVINRAGWVNGNSLNVISRGTGLGNSRWACYETNAAQAAKLTITTAAGGLVIARRVSTYIRM